MMAVPGNTSLAPIISAILWRRTTENRAWPQFQLLTHCARKYIFDPDRRARHRLLASEHRTVADGTPCTRARKRHGPRAAASDLHRAARRAALPRYALVRRQGEERQPRRVGRQGRARKRSRSRGAGKD